MIFFKHHDTYIEGKWCNSIEVISIILLQPSKLKLAFQLGLLFIFLPCFKVSANTCAQIITINLKDVSLEMAFDEIKKQTGYGFWYDKADLVDATKISVSIKNGTLEETLEQCFKNQPYTYEIFDKTIVVKRKAKNKDEQINVSSRDLIIKGKVTDEKGTPISGVNIKLLGTEKTTITNTEGLFSIQVPEENSVLQFTYMGFATIEHAIKDNRLLAIILKEDLNKLQSVEVVSTGLQSIPKERATGSFATIDSALFNRRVGTTVLERLDGVVSGVFFNGTRVPRAIAPPSSGSLGINIRGQSTLSDDVNKDPLIILDNFPYEGTLDNLNPNDVENITVLKDAAAASIWGARSGNGVIVITTKKGRLNQKPVIQFNSNLTIGNRPDLFRDKKSLNAPAYIDIEKYLYGQGYFTANVNNTTTRSAVSPVVDILASSLSQTDKDAQIDALRSLDVRSDYEKYFYQKSVNQQYSFGIRGGGNQMVYAFSLGYDNNEDNLINNGYNRITLNAQNTYIPIKNLNIITALNYTRSKTLRNNQVGYGNLYPYADLVDDNGNALSIVKDYRTAYVNSMATLGFLDWKYRPFDEMNNGDNNDKTSNLLARISARYKFTSFLNAEILYQNETQKIETWEHYSTQTYYARNLINKFSIYNATTKTFTYNLPNGGILNQGRYERISNNGRLQLNYDQNFSKKNQITAIVGAEIREFTNNQNSYTIYGYDDEYGTVGTNLNYNTSYPTNPSGNGTIGAPINAMFGSTNRFLSYFANAAYTYDNRYTATLSGRKDGANIFGAKTNDKITPLWSAGLAWTASKEKFYRLDWLPYLRFRATYGFNGNVYNGSAYTIGQYGTSALTGAQIINALTAPNPELRWEKVKNINLGIDFANRANRVNGTIELWQKDGLELINEIPLAPSSGFTSFDGNSASTRTKGIDIELNSRNFTGGLKWNTTVLLNLQKDKVLEYNITQTSTSIQNYWGIAVVDKPLYSIFSYKWAGLDPTNGNPIGYINGANSKNYTGIINNFNADSLAFNGSARPTVFGAIRNDFTYQNFSLSVNITYKLGYVFRRPSTSINYAEVLANNGYSDVVDRWQKPGDEQHTTVPSLIYPTNSNRNRFYQYSEVLVEKADHIRLQDIRLGYQLTKNTWKNMPFHACQVYAYASNLGILWRANKYGIDPDLVSTNSSNLFPNPFTIAFGLNINL